MSEEEKSLSTEDDQIQRLLAQKLEATDEDVRKKLQRQIDKLRLSPQGRKEWQKQREIARESTREMEESS